jgi:putative lipoprotein
MAAVSGTVFYRERIALPPGAALTVQLADVSKADAPIDVIATETRILSTQVPVPFSLSYDPP